MLWQLPHGGNHRAPEQREIAGVFGKVDLRKRGDDPVEHSIGCAQKPAFLPGRTACVDDIGACLMMPQEVRDDLRFVLQVGVHQDDGVTGRVIERRSEGRLVSEIPGQDQQAKAGVPPRRCGQEFTRAVGAAIVDEDHLVRPTGQGVEDRRESHQQLRNDLLLVVNGDAYREAHGLVVPWKYSIDHSRPRMYGSTDSAWKWRSSRSCHA